MHSEWADADAATGTQVTVIVDRPFVFAILDRTTGLPVFAGQVSLPRSG